MKILITGGSGFIGRNLIKGLNKDYDVFSPTSKELDLTNSDTVEFYLRNKYFDYIIHTACIVSRSNSTNSPDMVYKNLTMFFNLMNSKSRFGKFINFSSGAEYDIRKDINNSSTLQNSYPTDYYGMSKNIIGRLIKGDPNVWNFRAFGVFGKDEIGGGFISSNIKRYKQQENFVLNQDRFFDFYYIKDLIKVVKYYIDNPKTTTPENVNLVYTNKLKLSGILNLINSLSHYNVDTVVKHPKLDKQYVGNNIGVPLKLDLIGLENGIKEIYNEL